MVLQAIELCVDTLGLHITIIIHIIITIKPSWENSQAKSLSVLSIFIVLAKNLSPHLQINLSPHLQIT